MSGGKVMLKRIVVSMVMLVAVSLYGDVLPVAAKDITGPTVTITSPATGMVVRMSTVSVQGTYTSTTPGAPRRATSEMKRKEEIRKFVD